MTQDKDTKIIGRLKTEKEEQKKAFDKLKEEFDRMKINAAQTAPTAFVPKKIVEETIVKSKLYIKIQLNKLL